MKPSCICAAVLTLLAIQSFAANGTMKGDGSAEKPFEIEDYGDLKAIGSGAYLYSSKYVVTKDIDASAERCSSWILQARLCWILWKMQMHLLERSTCFTV